MSSQKSSDRLKKIENATVTNERIIHDLQTIVKENKTTIAECVHDVETKYEFLQDRMDSIEKSLGQINKSIKELTKEIRK